MINHISSFDGDYSFLSNFYPTEVIFDGMIYPSSEHAFVAAKTTDGTTRRIISRLPTADAAKKYGRKIKLRDNWNQIRLDLMYEIVLSKFRHSQDLRNWLLLTGDSQLIEGNWWGDTFWGVCRGAGSNHLGKILMKVREELRG